jgi:23S rRNA (uracil1939-C5)-methyltransferase
VEQDKAGKIQDIIIDKIATGGDGIGFIDTKAVFVPYVLPGERVEIRIREQKKSYCRADLLKIITASPDRVDPVCPIYTECGGCNLQHVVYSGQERYKKAILQDCIERFSGIEGTVPQFIPGRPYGYRNRIRLHQDRDGRYGFRKRRSTEVVPVKFCPVCVSGVNRVLEDLTNTSSAARKTGSIDVFASDDGVSLSDTSDLFEVTVLHRKVTMRPNGFFQSNLKMLEDLISRIIGTLTAGKTGKAADLYAGVGVFSVFLGERFSRVIAVEKDGPAARAARVNLGENKDAVYRLAAVEDWIRSPEASSGFDWIVLDPPRTGLSLPVRRYLSSRPSAGIVYVSCDPATYARDLGDIVRAGYSIENLYLPDFYPQTGHIESCTVLRL